MFLNVIILIIALIRICKFYPKNQINCFLLQTAIPIFALETEDQTDELISLKLKMKLQRQLSLAHTNMILSVPPACRQRGLTDKKQLIYKDENILQLVKTIH